MVPFVRIVADNCTRMKGTAHRAGCIQCNSKECRKQFTVRVKSVLERGKVSLVKWVLAFHLLCSSKKGFSALQLQRELKLGSYRTAWFMLHRIRHAMDSGSLESPMEGTVEVDETYVGARKPRYKGRSKPGRGTNKQPVVALVQRDGSVRTRPIKHVDSKTLKGEVRKHVSPKAMIVTDDWKAYRGLDREFAGHEIVTHSNGEYVRYEEDGFVVHTNTAESFFALLKRAHFGVYHSMSRQHLHRYCCECEFRWDHRQLSDSERRDAAIRQMSGKRLRYQTPTKRGLTRSANVT